MKCHFLFCIIFTLSCLNAINAAKFKKDKPPTSIDLDMQYLDNQILDNNIKNHYSVSFINSTLYSQVLNQAYTFASGMFIGIHIEVEAWRADKNIIEEYASLIKQLRHKKDRASIKRMLEGDLDILNMIRKATSIRALWYLYKNALSNLITYNAPHPMFLELAINIFLDIDLLGIYQYVYNYEMHRELKMHRKKIIKQRHFKSPLYKQYQNATYAPVYKAISLMDLVYECVSIDVHAPNFINKLEFAVDNSLKLLEEEHTWINGTGVYDLAAEIISKLQLYKLLLPVLKGNPDFLTRLSNLRRQKPDMHYFKGGNIDNAMNRTLIDFHNSINIDFFFEWVNIFDTSQTPFTNFNITSAPLLESIVHTYITRYFMNFKVGLRSMDVSLFTPHALRFQPQKEVLERNIPLPETPHPSLEEETTVSFDFEEPDFAFTPYTNTDICIAPCNISPSHMEFNSSSLPHTHFQTLKNIISGNKRTGLANLKWMDVASLISAMGGTVKSVGGSIKMIGIGGGRGSVRFDRPHPGDRVGLCKAFVLRKIFKRWGVEEVGE